MVATEIGQLANTSADAVHNIEGLIGQINGLVKDTIKQTKESVENINHSSSLVEDTLKTFDSIFGNIDQVNGLVHELIKKVEKVDDVATNVAAISEQQAASSEEIWQHLSQWCVRLTILREIVKVFLRVQRS